MHDPTTMPAWLRGSCRRRSLLVLLPALLLPCRLPAQQPTAAAATPARGVPAAPAPTTLRILNHHEMAYAGPVEFATSLPEGRYASADGSASGTVAGGRGRVLVRLGPGESVTLRRGPGAAVGARGPLAVRGTDAGLELSWGGRPAGVLALALAVVPGKHGDLPAAERALAGVPQRWETGADGVLRGRLEAGAYRAQVELTTDAGGWLEGRARVTHSGADAGPAYVALVRRMTVPDARAARLRFNGKVLEGASSPATWERDFWYTRGVDWVSWSTGAVRTVVLNGFTPGPTMRRDTAWGEGSHFDVWERSAQQGNELFFVSEIAGPNQSQESSKYMPIHPYAPLVAGDTVRLKWRVALAAAPTPEWENGQLRVFAGYRGTRREGGAELVDLGVPGVAFGTSYFPYSTLTENFDFYRTPGLDKETWWPFSPAMWKQWRAFIPRMQTDLHVIRAMGFDWVRLHHLEMLRDMDRAEATAFLDWYTAQADSLGLSVLIDSEGPVEWLSFLAGRYGHIARRFELENEILIPGISDGDPARWTAEYRAVKAAAPQAQVFLTGVGNNGMFERLRALGVPFDRVGLHSYKHGPEWVESFQSSSLSTGGYATDIGLPASLTEFNWKNLTRLSPQARRPWFVRIYDEKLKSRALPEVFQFHFSETLGVNATIARNATRHYETISLDRRPKPEGVELMKLIRKYADPASPVARLVVEAPEMALQAGRGTAAFTLRNLTPRPLTVTLRPYAYEGLVPTLTAPARVTVPARGSVRGRVALALPAGAPAGTYHWFLRAELAGAPAGQGTRWGWGVAANPGAPSFETGPVLAGRVQYAQGPELVQRIRWDRPLAAVFGADAPVLEMEMAYLLANTLQSATGRPVLLTPVEELPDSIRERGTVFVAGTSKTNKLIGPAPISAGASVGIVSLRESGAGQQVLFTGADPRAVEAAASDFVLRFWKNAKDSAMRITGVEPGNALGHPARVTNPDPP